MSHSDSMFFTNEPGKELLDRFRILIKGFQYFDVLVGYFRSSGFYLLCDELEKVDKIRILVGVEADPKTVALAKYSRGVEQLFIPFSNQKATEKIMTETVQEMSEADDTLSLENGARKFVEFLNTPCIDEAADKLLGNNGRKMEIRVYPDAQIHAKVYIGRFPSGSVDFGRVITGSSNFSYSGLKSNLEFNVELKQRSDYDFVEERFDELWKKSTDITDFYSATLTEKTWLDDSITPYEIYLKMLYEYLKEELCDTSDEDELYLPDGFMELEFQQHATSSAYKILNAYGGVFLADVVGLGKTYMAALLAQRFSGRHLVICPPTLKTYWEETFREFGIRRFDVESVGKLENVLHDMETKGKNYVCVFVDEAHRFRNEYTQGFELLHRICVNRKVVLVSATPLNNTLDDIFNLLKLFQKPQKSTIPGVANLDNFFSNIRKRLSAFVKGTPEYFRELQQASKDTRDKILRYVMVRRTRSEIARFYADDIAKQGLKFPIVAPPDRIIYRHDSVMVEAFNKTINAIKTFKYARYTPLVYLKPSELIDVEDIKKKIQQQANVGGFMKMILVKRLESSIYAFRNSVCRFIVSYEKFITMFERGKVLIGQKSDIYNLLEEDDETISLIVDTEGGEEYEALKFTADFYIDLQNDLTMLKSIKNVWSMIDNDPKLDAFIHELKTNEKLCGQQIVIFTESKETGEYVNERLEKEFPNKSIFFSASGGIRGKDTLNKQVARLLIQENFDPRENGGGLRFLVTTDVLSEGVNLHRAGIVTNYDLPWNPTRILQRVGRVNRIGSVNDIVRIYNFFPTDEQEEQIGLERTIKQKLQAFHDALGEDAKYLSDEEVVGTYTLFGENIYDRLNKSATDGEDADERSELEYLQIIRDVRKKDPQLFAKIESIPQKARTGRKIDVSFIGDKHKNPSLISFFKQGLLKKFIYSGENGEQNELTFLDAVNYFKCAQNEKRVFPELERYYELLIKNKEWFRKSSADNDMLEPSRGKSSPAKKWLIGYISAIISGIGSFEDKNFLSSVRNVVNDGTLPNTIVQRIKKKLEKVINPYTGFDILKAEIPTEYMQKEVTAVKPCVEEKHEVILSEWIDCQ